MYWNEYRAGSQNKDATNNYWHFLQSNSIGVHKFFVLVYSNDNDDVKRYKSWRYYLQKGVMTNYNVTINGKNQPIGSDLKQCKEIRKLVTRLLDFVWLHQRS